MNKKLLRTFLCFLLSLLFLTGCSQGTGQTNVEGSLEDLVQKIYDHTGEAVELPRGVVNIPLSEDMGSEGGAGIEYYLGAKGIPFTEGVASESLIGAVAYSLVLLRIEDNADMAAVKKQIQDNAPIDKWICVAVDPGDVVVDNLGNLLILIMSENSAVLHESFLKLTEQS